MSHKNSYLNGFVVLVDVEIEGRSILLRGICMYTCEITDKIRKNIFFSASFVFLRIYIRICIAAVSQVSILAKVRIELRSQFTQSEELTKFSNIEIFFVSIDRNSNSISI